MFGRRAKARGYFDAPAAVPTAEGLGARARNWLRLALTGAVGILAAIIVDLRNRGDDSALFVVARSLVGAAAMVGVTTLPLWVTLGVLMMVGAGVVLYFRPHGLRPAFLTGFGSLAALTTAVPGYSGEAPDVPVEGRVPAAAPVIEPRDLPEVQAQAPPPMRLAGFAGASDAPASEGRYRLTLRIAFPEGVPEPVAQNIRDGLIKARLYDPASRRAYDAFGAADGPVYRDDDALELSLALPASAEESPLMLRVEAAGYRIEVAGLTASTASPTTWEVVLAPSAEPLLIQRLKHTYAF